VLRLRFSSLLKNKVTICIAGNLLNWFLTKRHDDLSNIFKNASHCTSTNVVSPGPFVSYSNFFLPLQRLKKQERILITLNQQTQTP
jgi:hypothetical protein